MAGMKTLVLLFASVTVAVVASAAVPDLDAYDWRDGRSLTVEGRGFARTVGPYGRLPLDRVDDLPPTVAGRWGMREHTTGVNVRFVPHASKICLRWRVADPRAVDAFMGPTAMTGLDVYGWRPGVGWRFAANPRYFFHSDEKFAGTYELDWEPGRPCMVYLPLRSDVQLFEVGVPKGSSVEPMAPHGAKRRIVHYGTSIVHGGCCSRPGMALTCQEGRLCDLEVVNLGFSGGGRMESTMCKLIASVDAALYVVDCDWNMTVDLQKQNYEPFVRELKALRPDTPILLCGGCTQGTSPRTQEVYARGVYDKLKAEDAAKWANLHFLGGVEMLPKDDECTFDHCHPNDYGFMHMAKVYAAKIKSILGR